MTAALRAWFTCPHERRTRRPIDTTGATLARQGAARRRSRHARLADARGHRRCKPLYTAADLEELETVGGLPGHRAVRARAAGDDVREPAVDDPPVRGLLDRRGVERVLPPEPRGRADGSVGRVRPRDAPRLRQRPPARRRRRRQGRRRDRLRRGHEDPLRRHPARQDVGVDDDERRGAAGARGLHRRRARSRASRQEQLTRDDPERHPQRVHGPQHLHLSARAEHADRRRHHRVHGAAHAEVQLDLDLRLPHARGGRDRGAGARLHARRRPRVRALRRGARPRRRRVRRPALVLLRDRHELLHGGREAARRAPAVGAHHDRPRRAEAGLEDAAHALPDVGRVAHRAGPVQQHRAHRVRGAGRGARRHAEPAHEQLRRGDRAAVRLRGAHRAQHAADPRRGDRHHPRGRSARRLVLRRGAHAEPRQRGVDAHPGGRGARRHDQGRRVGHAEAAHRGGRGPAPGARRPRRGDDRRRQQVPARPNESPIDTRDIDNTEVRRQQLARLEQIKADARSRSRSQAALDALTERRGGRRQPARAVDRGDAGARDGRRDLRRDGEGVRPPPRRSSARSPACTAARTPTTRSSQRIRKEVDAFAHGGRPAAAHPRRQARPGRPRPRRQGDRDRVRRPRLRRRHRPAVPDARGSRAATRSRTTCTWSASRARPPGTRRSCRSSSRRCARRARSDDRRGRRRRDPRVTTTTSCTTRASARCSGRAATSRAASEILDVGAQAPPRDDDADG